MQFIDNDDILAFCVIIFRRLYNFFPKYRKHLEDPIIIILVAILKTYGRILKAGGINLNQSPHLVAKAIN